jgi:hypothetical protein
MASRDDFKRAKQSEGRTSVSPHSRQALALMDRPNISKTLPALALFLETLYHPSHARHHPVAERHGCRRSKSHRGIASAGLENREIAEIMGISERTVERAWALCQSLAARGVQPRLRQPSRILQNKPRNRVGWRPKNPLL